MQMVMYSDCVSDRTQPTAAGERLYLPCSAQHFEKSARFIYADLAADTVAAAAAAAAVSDGGGDDADDDDGNIAGDS